MLKVYGSHFCPYTLECIRKYNAAGIQYEFHDISEGLLDLKQFLIIRDNNEEEFAEAMEAAKADPQKARQMASLLAYQDMAHGQKTTDVNRDNDYTTQVLYRLGFAWSPTSNLLMRGLYEITMLFSSYLELITFLPFITA